MEIRKDEVKVGSYYKLVNRNYPEDSCIVYAYINQDEKLFDGITDNPNKGKIGFGFNIADGGVWIPAFAISEKTIIIELKITELV